MRFPVAHRTAACPVNAIGTHDAEAMAGQARDGPIDCAAGPAVVNARNSCVFKHTTASHHQTPLDTTTHMAPSTPRQARPFGASELRESARAEHHHHHSIPLAHDKRDCCRPRQASGTRRACKQGPKSPAVACADSAALLRVALPSPAQLHRVSFCCKQRPQK